MELRDPVDYYFCSKTESNRIIRLTQQPTKSLGSRSITSEEGSQVVLVCDPPTLSTQDSPYRPLLEVRLF